MRQTHWKIAIVMVLVAVFCTTAYAAKARKDKPKRVPAAKTAPAGESERQVTEDQVPAAALKTLKTLARKAEITEFAEEIENGSTFYEGSWKTKAGTNVDVLVTKAGALVEIEEQIPAKKLPAAALKAAQKLAGKGAEVACEQKTMVLYEIKFTKDGAGHEVLLTPDGRVVEQEIEKGKSDDGDEDESEVRNRDNKDGDDEENGDDEEDDDADEDQENGRKVSVNDVPKAVKATVRKHLDGGEIEDIERIKSEKEVIYEVDIIINGKEVELRVGADGKVLSKKVETDGKGNDEEDEGGDENGDNEDEDENEVGVSIKDVPKAVRATILKVAGDGKAEEITKEKEDGKVVYDVEIKVGGKEYELEIAANGKLQEKEMILTDEEDGDDDDDDEDADDEDDEDADDHGDADEEDGDDGDEDEEDDD